MKESKFWNVFDCLCVLEGMLHAIKSANARKYYIIYYLYNLFLFQLFFSKEFLDYIVRRLWVSIKSCKIIIVSKITQN